MTTPSGPGSSLWNQLAKVRVTRGKIEAPVRANGTDGIQVGDYRLPKPEPRDPDRVGLLTRLLRRRRA